ncbi:hypothetical protein PGO_090060 [Plasmodium gonderi]|uniref:Uncharacterized protein n=1 Tax=Plasmodium gonderi TaxID=77519 RepID=A0A1Y1JEY5_PLAGO|nr:hypothetical protein PGO_090060 [Plasmodium gonderi]GAW80810.1 hypothetical protein PGO_090060 [Plasmodium gonderi]
MKNSNKELKKQFQSYKEFCYKQLYYKSNILCLNNKGIYTDIAKVLKKCRHSIVKKKLPFNLIKFSSKIRRYNDTTNLLILVGVYNVFILQFTVANAEDSVSRPVQGEQMSNGTTTVNITKEAAKVGLMSGVQIAQITKCMVESIIDLIKCLINKGTKFDCSKRTPSKKANVTYYYSCQDANCEYYYQYTQHGEEMCIENIDEHSVSSIDSMEDTDCNAPNQRVKKGEKEKSEEKNKEKKNDNNKGNKKDQKEKDKKNSSNKTPALQSKCSKNDNFTVGYNPTPK